MGATGVDFVAVASSPTRRRCSISGWTWRRRTSERASLRASESTGSVFGSLVHRERRAWRNARGAPVSACVRCRLVDPVDQGGAARRSTAGEVVAVGRGARSPTEPPVSGRPGAGGGAAERPRQTSSRGCDSASPDCGRGQQHAVVTERRPPLRPAPLWNDTTSADQAARLIETFGALVGATLRIRCGGLVHDHGSWRAPRASPGRVRRCRTGDAAARLDHLGCGEHVTDRGDASGTGWSTPDVNAYSAELIATVVGQARPRPRGSTGCRPCGRPSPCRPAAATTASSWGCPPASPWGPVWRQHGRRARDRPRRRRCRDLARHVGHGVQVSPTATPIRGLRRRVADSSGRYLPLCARCDATKVTDTVAGWLGRDAAELRRARPIGRPGRTQPVVVPYFDGERTPQPADGHRIGARVAPVDQRRRHRFAPPHLGVLCGRSTDATSWHALARRSPVRCASSEAVPTLRPTVCCSPTSSVKTIVVPIVVEAVARGACKPPWSPVGAAPPRWSSAWRLGEGIDVALRLGADGTACRAACRRP